MPLENSQSEADPLPLGAPQVGPVDASVRTKFTKASSGKQKIQRSPRALRPLWYSIPIPAIMLNVTAYLIGLSLWSRSSLSHWKAQEHNITQMGYEGQMAWTEIGIERWVAHYNHGITLMCQGQTDEGVTDPCTVFGLVLKATEAKPGRLEPSSYERRARVNLAIGIEIQGGVRAVAGAYVNATTIYQEAEETVAPYQTAPNFGQNRLDDQDQPDNKDQLSNQNQPGKQGQSDDQQQSGDQSDSPVDQNKERVEDKKQKTEGQSRGQDDQQQDQQGKGPKDQWDEGLKDQQVNPSPSLSPSSNPYEGETPEERQRREELQHKNDQRNKDQRDKKDDHRSGSPNGVR